MKTSMKKFKIFALLGFGLGLGIAFGAKSVSYSAARAEGEEEPTPAVTETAEPTPIATATEEPEVFESKIVLPETLKHGKIKADKLEGHVGDIVSITASHDLFYTVSYVAVNGVNLVEDAEISGLYTFALAEGENVITAKFVVDKELLGQVAPIVEQIQNGDWANLFTVENVIRIVTFLLGGGLLLAMVRYYVKDKRLEKKLEEKVTNVMNDIVPWVTRETVAATIEKFITPIFTELNIKIEEQNNALTVFSRCFALAQEDTPEARIAITQELSSLKLGDQETISRVREDIIAFVKQQQADMKALMARFDELEAHNKQILAEKAEKEEESPEVDEGVVEEIPVDDGTQN